MIYNKILNDLKKNKAIREGGKHLGIPVPFSRLSEQVPLIERGQSIGLLGASGIGKSPLARFLFLYTPYKFYKDTGYKIKIFFFCLEDNVEKVYHHCICNYLYLEHNIICTPKDLTSKTAALPQFVVDKIEEAQEYFKEFEDIVEFVWDVHKPKDIYGLLRDYAQKTGKLTKTKKLNKEGVEITQYHYHSDVHTIVIFDNMSNLDIDEEDDAESERKAMIRLARSYTRAKLVNVLNFTVVQVMQLDFQSERQQFTSSGMTVLSKIEPSLAGIGDAKTIARSMHLIIGLFDPSRYELMHYPIPSSKDPENCYRLDILGKNFRAIKVLKNNDGPCGGRIGLMFNYSAETFEELPKPKTPELKRLYESMSGSYKKINTKDLDTVKDSSTFAEDTPF